MIQQSISFYLKIVTKLQQLDFIPLLLLRLYLTPVMMQAGWTKLQSFDSTLSWFANPDWGLGLPAPALLLYLVILLELGGGLALLLGLFTRLTAFGLSMTMLVAMLTVHAKNGWLAIADASSWLADGTIFSNEAVMAAPEKLAKANEILQQQPDYDWLVSSGKLVVLNNGIEFAATYFVMLLVLVVYGAGRWLSLDYWLSRRVIKVLTAKEVES
ncbi:DoxX family membrane protein [Rheinheimera sp. 1928-s]|uniref:HvfX family Cu-binding RiPP maturation protein n=1 Tax=Rheinheimera sp. 1928-s TaxID=3033803 RepID=UPI0026197E91|nr:DoxX family membrane protein [Rheinheimera sp. 1928-s]MDF3126376.1 DoxX family membrane protein [Rheinheimera sp. 1928-s]